MLNPGERGLLVTEEVSQASLDYVKGRSTSTSVIIVANIMLNPGKMTIGIVN